MLPGSTDGPKTIFLVEDDMELAVLTKERLEKEGYIVSHEVNGTEARKRIVEDMPDLVVLDVMLPGMDGFEVCKAVRPVYKGPILILTARDSDLDQILGLELGADDFVIKPVRPRILLARIRALLRRIEPAGDKQVPLELTCGAIFIDAARREAKINGSPFDLTTAEFDMLWYLASNAGQVVSRNDIHLALYNIEYDGLDRSIDVYISRLRKKLGDDPANPHYLKTVRGVGYLFTGA